MPSATYLAMRAYTRARIVRGRITGRGRGWSGVRILGYHSISDDRHVLAVRPRAFATQMEVLASADVEIVSLAEAVARLLDGRVAGRYACVTFDDGYRDNLERGVPVLERLGIPATIFVPTRIIDGEAAYWWFREPPPALGWDELRDLAAGGLVDVQAHTRTHPFLPRVEDERARDEIFGCRDDLAARLGRAATTFCYPAGLYGERELALVREAGYRAAVTTDPGVNHAHPVPETLQRTLVYWEDSLADFRAKLDGLLDRPPALRALLYRRRAAA